MEGATQHCLYSAVPVLLLSSQWGFSSDQLPILLFHIVALNLCTSGGQKEYLTPKYLCVVLLDVPAQVTDGHHRVGVMDRSGYCRGACPGAECSGT